MSAVMTYAPDGRLLSPGEVWEEATAQVKDEEWQDDLNVLLICPDCRENPPNLIEEFSCGDTIVCLLEDDLIYIQ